MQKVSKSNKRLDILPNTPQQKQHRQTHTSQQTRRKGKNINLDYGISFEF